MTRLTLLVLGELVVLALAVVAVPALDMAVNYKEIAGRKPGEGQVELDPTIGPPGLNLTLRLKDYDIKVAKLIDRAVTYFWGGKEMTFTLSEEQLRQLLAGDAVSGKLSDGTEFTVNKTSDPSSAK